MIGFSKGFSYLVGLGVDVSNDPSTLETYTHTHTLSYFIDASSRLEMNERIELGLGLRVPAATVPTLPDDHYRAAVFLVKAKTGGVDMYCRDCDTDCDMAGRPCLGRATSTYLLLTLLGECTSTSTSTSTHDGPSCTPTSYRESEPHG